MKSIDDIIDSDHDNDDLETPVIDDKPTVRSPHVAATRRQTDIDSLDSHRSTAIDSSIYNVSSTTGSEIASGHQISKKSTFPSVVYRWPQVEQLQHESTTSLDDIATSKDSDERPIGEVRPAANDPLSGRVISTRKTGEVRQDEDGPVRQLHGTRLSDVCQRLLNHGGGHDGAVSSVQPRVATVDETAIDEIDEALPSCVTSTIGSLVLTENAPVIVYQCTQSSGHQSRDFLKMPMTHQSIPETASSESHFLVAPTQGALTSPDVVSRPLATLSGITPSGKPKPPVPPKPRSALVTSPAAPVSQQQLRHLVKSTPPPIAAKPALLPKPTIAKKPPIGSRGDKSPGTGASSAASPLPRQVSSPSSSSVPTAADELWSPEHGAPVSKDCKYGTAVVISSSKEILRNGDQSVGPDPGSTSLLNSSTLELVVTDNVSATVDRVQMVEIQAAVLYNASRQTPEVERVAVKSDKLQRTRDAGDSHLVTTSPRTVEETGHVIDRLDSSRRGTSADIERDVKSSTTSSIPSRKSEVSRASSIGSRRPLKSDSDASPLAYSIKTTSEERLLPVRQGIVSSVHHSPLPGNDHDRDASNGARRSSRGRSVDLTAPGCYDGGNFPTSVRSSGGSVSSIGRKTISREVVTVTTTEEEIITVLRRPETHSPDTTSGLQTKATVVDHTSRSFSSVSDRDVDQPPRKSITPKMATDDVIVQKNMSQTNRTTLSEFDADINSDISVGDCEKADFDRNSTVSLPARISFTFDPSYVRRHDSDVDFLDTTMMTSSTSSDMLDKLIDTLTGIALAAAAEEEEDEQRRLQAAAAAATEEDDNDGTITSSAAATGGILQLRGHSRCGRDSGVGTVQTAASY